MTYREFFQLLTGFTPTPFQERVADALLAERSVVLQAPTGSGKSWAVIAPFMYAMFLDQPIADRLVYALPLRSLATSLFRSTHCDIAKCIAVQHLAERVRIQTGEQPKDPLFEALITFSTIDQLLSGYLLQPVGLPTRCGNINAGATLGALICFDEFHLLDPQKSMATAIEMLDTVAISKPLSRFVLMSATLSTSTLQWLAAKLKADLIDVPPDEVRELPSQLGKTRTYRWVNQPLTAAAVAKAHGGGRSIVIANTVSRAQELYEELLSDECRRIVGSNTRVRLLHSRFLTRDRQQLESDLDQWFGPQATAQDVMLVSTQVVEAGLDFSCDNLHTEVAPMNAVVQRAGRCARRKGETGTVCCYALNVGVSGKPAYGPYTDISSLVDSTANALEQNIGDPGRALEFHDELQFVDTVHTDWELKALRPLANLTAHRRSVRAAMDAASPAAVRELIRDVSSINVVITDQPDKMNFRRTEWPEMLSVPPMSLFRLFSADAVSADDWIAKAAREQEVFEGGTIRIEWVDLRSAAELRTAGWLVAIHPSRATYDANVGLVVGRGGPAAEIQYRKRPKIARYSYAYEEYPEHIRRVCQAGNRRDHEYRVTTRRLSAALGTTEAQLATWLHLMYGLHDVGKLSIDWQDAIWEWQQKKTGAAPTQRPALAHSDCDPDTDWELAKSVRRRPPHAAEGAYAVAELLAAEFGDDSDGDFRETAALTAITRHHGAFTSNLSDFRLIPGAGALVAATLQRGPANVALADLPGRQARATYGECLLEATNPEHSATLLLYLYLVRRLRLADQSSFKED